MRIESIRVKEAVPVRKFEVDGLTNMVFLAGPNGIGKSRLIEAILAYLRSPHDIIDYIEMFYNCKCRHSYLGYLSPMEYEKRWFLRKVA